MTQPVLPYDSHAVVGPILEWSTREIDAFEGLLARVSPSGRELELEPGLTKHRFLSYATERAGLLAHGTTRGDLTALQPGDQGDLEGRPVRAVFASSDGVWAMFFAILDWSRVTGTFNGTRLLSSVDGDRRGYVFTVFTNRRPWSPFNPGWVYLLDRSTFSVSLDATGAPSDEWISTVPVESLARLAVCPDDFPYVSDVTVHLRDD